jgi:hypothetical protein
LQSLLRWNGNGLVHDFSEHVPEALAVEGELSRHALVDDDRERKEVRAVVDALDALCLLRAHVERRPEQGAGLGSPYRKARLRFLRDAEVEHFHDFLVAIPRQEDVLGFQIAVHDAGGVRSAEALGDLRNDPHRERVRQAHEAIEPRAEILSLEVLHRDERHLFPDAVIEDLHDVLTAQLRRRFRLALETSADVGAVLIAIDELDGARDFEREVVGEPNRAHPSLPQEAHELETPGYLHPLRKLQLVTFARWKSFVEPQRQESSIDSIAHGLVETRPKSERFRVCG